MRFLSRYCVFFGALALGGCAKAEAPLVEEVAAPLTGDVTCAETPTRPAIAMNIVWPTAPVAPSGSLRGTIVANFGEPVEGQLVLHAFLPDGRSVVRPLDKVAVTSELAVKIPMDALPARTPEAKIRYQVELDLAPGKSFDGGPVILAELVAQQDASGNFVVAAAAPSAPARAGDLVGSVDEKRVALLNRLGIRGISKGEVWSASKGGFVDWNAFGPIHDEQIAPGATVAIHAQDAAALFPAGTPFRDGASPSLCVQLAYSPNDAQGAPTYSFLQENTPAPFVAVDKVAYAAVRIHELTYAADGTLKSDVPGSLLGLDKDGCTGAIQFKEYASYGLELQPFLYNVRGSNNRVYVEREQTGQRPVLYTTFSVSKRSPTIPITIRFAPWSVDPTTESLFSAFAATARVAQTERLPFADATYKVRVYEHYDPNICYPSHSNACTHDGQWIELMPNLIPGTDSTLVESSPEWHNGRYRSVVAHEFGHAVQNGLGAALGTLYDATVAPTYSQACGCDVVLDATSRSHCLQSSEHIGSAQQEAMGHIFATEAFQPGNVFHESPKGPELLPPDPTKDYCLFGYYKDFWSPAAPGLLKKSQPSQVLCGPNYQWRKNRCGFPKKQGVELDWLGFYYAIQRDGKLPLATILGGYNAECGVHNDCGTPQNQTLDRLVEGVTLRTGTSKSGDAVKAAGLNFGLQEP